MKGVSSVIAAILLLLIIIAIVGFAFTFLAKTAQQSTIGAETQLSNQQQHLSTSFQIESIDGNRVYVRNTGTAPLTSDQIVIFINGILVDFTGPASIGNLETGVYVLNQARLSEIPNPSEIRISSSGWVNEQTVSTAVFNQGGQPEFGISNYTLFISDAGYYTRRSYSKNFDSYNLPKAGSSVVTDGSGVSWINPSDALTENNIGSNVVLSASAETSSLLKLTGFGFSIPSNAEITGINVTVKRKANASTSTNNVTDYTIRLIKNGLVQGDNKAATNTRHLTGFLTKSYGNALDKWGLALTPNDVNANDFGIAFGVRGRVTTMASINATVDSINMTVFYMVRTKFSITARFNSTGINNCELSGKKQFFVAMTNEFDNSKLYMGESFDGVNFKNLNASTGAMFSGKDGLAVIDSDILYRQGQYYLVYHQRSENISFAVSTNMSDWHDIAHVPVTKHIDVEPFWEGISDPFWIIDKNGNTHVFYQLGSVLQDGTFVANTYMEIHPKSEDTSTWNSANGWSSSFDIKDISGNNITDGGDSFVINTTNGNYVMLYVDPSYVWKKRTSTNLTHGWSNYVVVTGLVDGEQPSAYLLPDGRLRFFITYDGRPQIFQDSTDATFTTWGAPTTTNLIGFSGMELSTPISWGKFRILPFNYVTSPQADACRWNLPSDISQTYDLLASTAAKSASTQVAFSVSNVSVLSPPNFINTFTLQNNGPMDMFYQLNVSDPDSYITRISPQSFNGSLAAGSSVDLVASWQIS